MTRVVRDAPAARAGLRPGDVITSIDNRDIPTPAELAAIISAQQVGARVMVGVLRSGATRHACRSRSPTSRGSRSRTASR